MVYPWFTHGPWFIHGLPPQISLTWLSLDAWSLRLGSSCFERRAATRRFVSRKDGGGGVEGFAGEETGGVWECGQGGLRVISHENNYSHL